MLVGISTKNVRLIPFEFNVLKNNNFQFNQLNIGYRLPEFLLIDSGKPVESTGEMVAALRQKYQISNIKYQKIFKKAGDTTAKFIKWLAKMNSDNLRNLILENEKLLEELGVVGNKAKKIIRLIEKNNGAAKICGAGGIKEGSGMILSYHQDLDKLKQVLAENRLSYLDIKLGEKGVKIEKN